MASWYKRKNNWLKYILKGLQSSQKKNVAYTEREFFVPSLDLEHGCKQKEKSMGINTVRLHICHHQIVGTGTGTFFSIFLDLGMKYYFLLSFFVG